MKAKPIRIKRSRQNKQVSPNGLPIIYVGRGSRWGNPFKICELINGKFAISHECDYQLHQITKEVGCDSKHYNTKCEAAIDAIKCYELYHHAKDSANMADAITNLKGKNLSCWCKLDDKCHADLLLELANR